MATKLKAARIANFRGISLLEMAPTETVLKITGPNGSNKTNALSAILGAIDPGSFDGEAIKYGEKEATSEIDLALEDGGTLTIARRWYTTKGGQRKTEVEIRRVNGDDVSSYDAKAVLPKLLGPFSDCRQFLNVRTPTQERELADALLKSAGVSVADADAAIESATVERRNVKTALANAEARLSALPKPRPGLPDKEVSIAERAAEVAGWRDRAREYEVARIQAASASGVADSAIEERDALREALRLADEAVVRANKAAEAATVAFELMPEPPAPERIAEAETSMRTLETTNAEIRSAATYRELSAEVSSAGKAVDAAEKAVADTRSAKLALLASAELPIAGLVVTEDAAVTYEGVGLHELSEGQKLVVGCAIAIATKGSLSAIFVDGGESIDATNEAKAVAMCESAGITLIIAETVKSATGLVIRGADWNAEVAA